MKTETIKYQRGDFIITLRNIDTSSDAMPRLEHWLGLARQHGLALIDAEQMAQSHEETTRVYELEFDQRG